MLDRIILQQASAWSYVDVFRDLAFLSFLCIPIVFFLKKAKSRPGAAPVH